ncbi:hypothetical protein [Alicyclobacillus sp. SO9]|uniref:hypothetical protein n=1 Tax=Alicyclobacillus sp. SO9 TaxID=2665646 RepID=UPI0018E76782|nr:hypothetical protein [Alicyclobacillus sp. SO9]QQE79349.1 hypothetical protein GI364_02225 [Alicyclobacillus sp. SO9]
MAIYRFGANPDQEFKAGRLQGFSRKDITRSDVKSEAAQKLYAEMRSDPKDFDCILGKLPDGRLALLGLTLPDHKYAVQGE